MRNYSSLVGETIGELLVKEEYSESSKTGTKIFCICECSCGRVVTRRKDYLKIYRYDRHISCGHSEQVFEEFDDNTIVGYANNGTSFLFDKKDFDRVRTDCRRDNLRICTPTDNLRNSTIQKRNKSGVIGVFMPPNRSYWESRITVDKQVIILGYFYDFDEAVAYRLRAEKEYFGEFAPQKHLFQKYGV